MNLLLFTLQDSVSSIVITINPFQVCILYASQYLEIVMIATAFSLTLALATCTY